MNATAHLRRMITGLGLALVLAFCAQQLLLPKGFGEAGHYRIGSLSEIMANEPVHQGKAICAECHEDIATVHGKDVHYNVKCEDCHGPGNLHVAYYMDEPDSMVAEQAAVMPREYTLEGCLFCHRKLKARPADFPQVDPADHYTFLHVNTAETRCIECHSPHEPLYLLTEVAQARLHPVIHECSACHAAPPAGMDHRMVPGHPAIFECSDCHSALVADFKEHNHASIRCTACHQFHKENDTAGRIFKNGNQRFCLLCHERKPFKEAGGAPLIDRAAHFKEMTELPEEDEMYADPKMCIECHIGNIHDRSNY